MIKIGQILTTHGHKGEVKVLPLTDDSKRYEKLEYAYLEIPEGYKKIHIDQVRYHKNNVILKIAEVKDMDAAEKLRKTYICIAEEQLVNLPPEHYYIFQLINLDVYEGEVFLGKVKNVLQTGSHDVYVVQKGDREILIPALKSVVKKIDLNSKKILVELPEGLLD